MQYSDDDDVNNDDDEGVIDDDGDDDDNNEGSIAHECVAHHFAPLCVFVQLLQVLVNSDPLVAIGRIGDRRPTWVLYSQSSKI